MKIAIVGGGFTGLTTAYELSKQGHQVTVFEKEAYLGGLAFGFKEKSWDWSLEYAYHHLFTNDDAILNLAKEIGLEQQLITKRPITASLYDGKVYQLDSVRSLLTFPGMPLVDRIRTGIFIASLKFNPFWKPLEKITAKEFALIVGGEAGWKAIWEPLMVGKFSGYADRIAASWLWARIVKRTPSLVYFEGGFHTFITTLEEKIKKQGGKVFTNTSITSITPITSPPSHAISISYGKKKESFDQVLLTIPTPLATKLVPQLADSLREALSIPHLHAQVMILETEEPVLKDIYWLNMTDRSFPFLAVVTHTNFMSSKHYNGKHLTYVGNYLPADHPFIKMTKEELLRKFLPYLKKLNPSFKTKTFISNSYLFTGPFAQPVHEKNYSTRAPKLETTIPNLYLANMDSVYPWDRGTNYAVELGQTAARYILNK